MITKEETIFDLYERRRCACSYAIPSILVWLGYLASPNLFSGNFWFMMILAFFSIHGTWSMCETTYKIRRAKQSR